MTLKEKTLEALERQIDELAREEVATLLHEARVEARAKVRGLLVDAIGERMLARAQEQLGSDPSAPVGLDLARSRGPRTATTDERADAPEAVRARTPQPVARGSEELGWYVYGVVAEGYEPPRELAGIDGAHPVTVVPAEGIAAVASRVPLAEFGEDALTEQVNDLAWLEINARRHEDILDRVRSQTTLVPMRLCTIYQGDTSVREMLAREHEFLVGALQRLDGRTEWGVKLFATAPAGLETRDEDRDGAGAQPHGAGPGAAYLLEKQLAGERAAEAEAALEERCEAVHARLSALAVESKLNPLQPPELTKREEQMLLNGVYLVDDRASREFERAAAALHDEHRARGLELELTGPWPPYNFVNDGSELGR